MFVRLVTSALRIQNARLNYHSVARNESESVVAAC